MTKKTLRQKLTNILGQPIQTVGISEMVWHIGHLDMRVIFNQNQHDVYVSDRDTGNIKEYAKYLPDDIIILASTYIGTRKLNGTG